MDAKSKGLYWYRHKEDRGWDEVRLVTESIVLRAVYVPRYKTSGLSGDEWRVSVGWQWRGGPDEEWAFFDGPRYGDLQAACSALYAGLFSSHQEWHQLRCLRVDWYRKGGKLYEQTHDGEALPLLATAGHLPWGLVVAGEHYHGRWPDRASECFQVSCQEEPVSTYALKHTYCYDGHQDEATMGKRRLARRFCKLHLRRGDCGLEDADRNYEVLDGPGPGEHETPTEQISASAFGGAFHVRPAK